MGVNTRTPEIYVYLPDLKPLKNCNLKITKNMEKSNKKKFFISQYAHCFFVFINSQKKLGKNLFYSLIIN